MIRLTDKPTFTAPVTVAEGGEITFTFRALSGARLVRWARAAGLSGGNRITRRLWLILAMLRRKLLADHLDEVIAGWEGVVGDDDQPLPYSLDALRLLLTQYPVSGQQIFLVYLTERTRALQKN